jgi:hypothetical protein
VPESNARIMGFQNFASIHANHIDMCKFSKASDEGYKSVSAAIKKFSEIKQAGKASVSHRFEEDVCVAIY